MFWKKIAALLRQRCPVCLEGSVFKKGMEMHARCPRCNILYERE